MVWHTQEEKLQFLQLEREIRNLSVAARQFGISRATANRWRSEANAKGRDFYEAEPPIGPASPATDQALIDLVWHHPTWNCHRYAEAITAMGMPRSARTIQRQLNGLGLGHKKERIFSVEVRSENDQVRPPASAWKELLDAGRPIDAMNFRRRYPGNILAFFSYRWLRRVTEYSYVIVAVDLYSQMVQTKIWDGSNIEAPIRTYLDITEYIRRRCFLKNPMAEVDGKPFANIGGIQFIPHFTNAPSGKRKTDEAPHFKAIDGTVRYVFSLMRSDLFPLLRKLAEANDIDLIRKGLGKWQWDYNLGHVNRGFPNFGNTPYQAIAQVSRRNEHMKVAD